MTEPKPQLHVSMLDMLSRCGIAFQRRYGARFGVWHQEEIVPPSIALATGSTVHRSVEKNLRTKIETGALLPREAVADHARDEALALWHEGVILTDAEAVNVTRTQGDMIDQSISLALCHYDNFAPEINPVQVEEKFVVTLEGYPFDLAGTIDLRESKRLGDVKTKAATPAGNPAISPQMDMYTLGWYSGSLDKALSGTLPELVKIYALIKTKVPKAVPFEAVPEKIWLNRILARIERAIIIIETVKEGKAVFAPADPEHPFSCSARYCGYSRSCPFWSGR